MTETAAPPSTPAWERLPFLLAGMLSLFLGAGAGLARLGWMAPDAVLALTPAHGPLMVSGFFGTLIALERAVALGRPWAYGAPGFAGLGGLALLAGAPEPVAPILFVIAALILSAICLVLYGRQKALFTAVVAAGACAWTSGNLIWAAGHPMPAAVPSWILFFVLTIAGERLELTRLLQPRPGARAAFLAATGVLLLGAIVDRAEVFGLGLVALALWLGVCDIARRTIHQNGLPRFTAACLLSGYVWLAAAGAVMSLLPFDAGGPAYDAALHAVLLGFVFAMVFGHAPIIFPAILRLDIPYHPAFYAPLALLHLSLATRWAGDLAESASIRLAGGLGNAAAILLFFALIAWRAAAARRRH